MKVFYFGLGILALLLAVLGIVLPVLPTAPFLLLAGFAFAKSSPRFEEKVKQSRLYHYYLDDYLTNRSLTRKKKYQILAQIYCFMVISIFIAPIIWVKWGLGIFLLFVTFVVLKVVKTRD